MKSERAKELIVEFFLKRNGADVPASDLYKYVVKTHGVPVRDYSDTRKALGLYEWGGKGYKVGKYYWYRAPECARDQRMKALIDNLSKDYNDWEEFWAAMKPLLQAKKEEFL